MYIVVTSDIGKVIISNNVRVGFKYVCGLEIDIKNSEHPWRRQETFLRKTNTVKLIN